MTKRNDFLDILKGILIISVVFGHALQYGSGSLFLQSELYWEHPLMRLIYSVHMPLFMAIAGYLTCFSLQRHPALTYITRRWIKLFPPILTWSVLLLLMRGCVTKHLPGIPDVLSGILTTFWFLWSILICSSLVAICEKIKFPILKSLVYVTLVLIFAGTPDILWWHAHKFMFVCFLSGFYVAKYQPHFHLTPAKGLLAGVLWIFSIFLFHKETYIYISGLCKMVCIIPRHVNCGYSNSQWTFYVGKTDYGFEFC